MDRVDRRGADDGTGRGPDYDIRPDSTGTTGCFIERSVTDANEREDHRDLNPDGEHAQTCSDGPLT